MIRKLTGTVLILAGAVIAFTIGSGFATGQEIIQYYTAYGGAGNFLRCYCLRSASIYYNLQLCLRPEQREHFEKGNDVYKFYCGKYVGTFMDYYSTIFCYMSFFVMVGGAASTLNQQYGLPSWVGGVVLTALAILTVVGDLIHWLTRSVWLARLSLYSVSVSAWIYLFRDAGNVGAGLEVIRTGAFAEAGSETIKNAGPNWVISALSYAGFVLLWFASFTAALGANNKKKDVEYGIYGGTIAVCVAIVLIMLAQVANINTARSGKYRHLRMECRHPQPDPGRTHLEALCILLCNRGVCRYLYNSSAASV